MDMSITEAKARLTDLVRRAEAGEDIVLTRHGQPAVRLVAVKVVKPRTYEERLGFLDRLQAEVAAMGLARETGASNHDDLYDDDGLPV